MTGEDIELADAIARGCAKCSHINYYRDPGGLITAPGYNRMRCPDCGASALMRADQGYSRNDVLNALDHAGPKPPSPAVPSGEGAGAVTHSRFLADLTPYGKLVGMCQFHERIFIAMERGLFVVVGAPGAERMEPVPFAPAPGAPL